MRFEPRRPAAAEPILILKQHLQPPPPTPPSSHGHHPADAPPAERPARCKCNPSWLTAVGFGFLTFNSGMAVHRSRGDRGAVAFVAFSYLDLLALFLCLRWYEAARPVSPLTLAFSSRVAALMPVAAAAVAVWLVAFGTVAGGFYAFFLCSNDKQ